MYIPRVFCSRGVKYFNLDAESGVISVKVAELDREDPEILAVYGVIEFRVLVRTKLKLHIHVLMNTLAYCLSIRAIHVL